MTDFKAPQRFGVVLTLCCAVGVAAFAAAHVDRPFGVWGVQTANISRDARPGDDFFTYVNDRWLKDARAPAGISTYGTFDAVSLEVEQRLNTVIDGAVQAHTADGDPRQEVADLYRSYMDASAIEAQGLKPLRTDLDRILTIRTHGDVARWMADPRSSSVVAIHVVPDAAAPTKLLVSLDQTDPDQPILGLPGRDYFIKDTERNLALRSEYQAYLRQLFEHLGLADGAVRATSVLALEHGLAELQWTQDQLRDRAANSHKLDFAALGVYAPGFPWTTFLQARGVGGVREVVLGSDTGLKAQAALFAQTPVETWKSYLLSHWITNQAFALSLDFQLPYFALYGTALGGQKEQRKREARATQFVNRRLGDTLGRLYVARYFSGDDRAQIEDLVGYLKRAFSARLAQVTWMDRPTLGEAQRKLDGLGVKLGYPKTTQKRLQVAIRADDLIGNNARLLAARWASSRDALSKPLDRMGWFQTPQTIDATYGPLANAIEFPAALLQPPFFDPKADPAVNFGAIGAIIGHEMGHALDDQGSKFDSEGRLRNWWSPASRAAFDARTQALVAQYDAYSPLAGTHIDGRQTIGENLGDLTGGTVAFDALHLYRIDHPETVPQSLDGYTPEQRFFLSWGQVWRVIQTDDALRATIQQGYHSPSKYRVNGPLRNIDGWYAAFDVKPTDRLYLPAGERVRVW